MELDKLIDLPQTEISFPYGVISSEEAHNLFLNRTELGGYRYSPYRFRDLDYQFQSWLEGREGGELYDNDETCVIQTLAGKIKMEKSSLTLELSSKFSKK